MGERGHIGRIVNCFYVQMRMLLKETEEGSANSSETVDAYINLSHGKNMGNPGG
jgi:hypothetical protein